MRRSIAAKLTEFREQTAQALAKDGEAIATAESLMQRVEALNTAVDEDRKVLDQWTV